MTKNQKKTNPKHDQNDFQRTPKGILFFISTEFEEEYPASMCLPRKLKATTLAAAKKEVFRKITDICAYGIVCQQIAEWK